MDNEGRCTDRALDGCSGGTAADRTTSTPPKPRLLLALRWVSLVAAVVALVCVARVLARSWRSAPVDWAHFSALGLAIAVPSAVASLLLVSLTWHWMLQQIGVPAGRLAALHAWFTGNLYKYIPGQIWMAVGRTVKGAQSGIPARATLGTTVIEQGFSLLAAGLFLGLARGWVGMIIICAALSGLLLSPRGVRGAIALVGRVTGRNLQMAPLGPSQLLVLYGVSLLNVALGILAMIGVMAGLGAFHLVQMQACVVAFTTSFLSGYLFFGAPAGLGVREGALLLLLHTEAGLTQGEASLVAVLTRVVTILVELACFSVVALLVRLRGPAERAQ